MIREAARPLNNNHGTTQRSRLTGALMPDHISVDERSLADLIAYAASYAKKIKYYNADGLYEDPESGELLDWTPFFEKSETVFLASLMSSDIHQNDEAIQAAFHQIHQLKDLDRQRENFASLVEALLSLSETLFTWYKKALSFGESGPLSYIVREVDRAMLGELGIQLRSFGTILKYLEGLKGSEKFAPASEDSWHDRLKPLLNYWYVQEATTLLSLSDQIDSALSEQLKFAGARLQEYHRRLYYTLSFIEEMIPDLFDKSVHEKGDHDPDIGLLIAFLRLFSHAQAELNTLSGRHLEYYNEEVLGRKPNDAIPDKTVICFLPNPVIDGVWLAAGTRLLAGVDAEGQPAYYQTDEELYVSQAKVAALKTMFVSSNPMVKTNSSYQLVTAIYAAPISNSADGQGMEFTGNDLSWPILGEDQFDLGTADRQMGTSVMGFAIASPILLMREGERKVTVRMQFTEDSFATLTTLLEDIAENSEGDSGIGDVFNSVFHRPFRLSVTVAEGWLPLKKYRILPLESNPGEPPSLSFEFILPTSTESIANCDPAIHGTDYHTSWPVLKALLSDEESLYSYSFLRDLELEEIGIDVQIEGLRNVAVYNDIGLLDASRPFVPFGPLPSRNSYLLLGHPELFNRELTSLDIDIDWGDLPEEPGGFAEHYAGYGKDITNDSFKFRLSALTDYKFQPVRTEEREVFNMFTTQLAAEAPLQSRTSLQLGVDSLKRLRLQPYYPLDELEEFTNTSRSGYLKFEFSEPQMAFGHTLYPRIFARQMAQNARPRPFSLLREEDAPLELPNEPYTPVINRLNVNYQAKTVINLRQLALKKRNQQADERLFRLHPFGTELVFGDGNLKSPFLLPRFDDEGYLMIGLRDFSPPSPISLFFNIAETKKKFNRAPLDINWSYLHHDEWRPFTADQILSDSTVKLSTRGIVKLLCPTGMTKGTGLMDSSLYWIRVSATGNLNITGRCKEIIPQAVQVSWVNNGDPEHLARPAEDRPPVSGLATPIPGIIGIQQPIPFFGGQPEECEEDFYVRGSERLRHKNRTVSLWDYERLILERFPEIQQVKCIGQHGYEDQLTIGEVLVIVVPVINEVDHQPKVGYRVLAEVEDYLKTLSTPFAKFRVINPVYEQLRINCKIKLRPESVHKQGIVWQEIHDAITAFVCPWLRDGNLQLGASISKTEVFAIINENPHVAFATAFSIVQVFEQEEDNLKLKDTAVPDAQSELLIPSKTWSVLVPVREHEIIFLDQDEYQSDEITAIDRMRLGADFIVTNTDDDASPTSSNTHKAPKEKFLKAPSKWLLG